MTSSGHSELTQFPSTAKHYYYHPREVIPPNRRNPYTMAMTETKGYELNACAVEEQEGNTTTQRFTLVRVWGRATMSCAGKQRYQSFATESSAPNCLSVIH